MSHAASNTSDTGVDVVGCRLSEAGTALTTNGSRNVSHAVGNGGHTRILIVLGSDDLRRGAGSALCSRSLVTAVWNLKGAAVNGVGSELRVSRIATAAGYRRDLGLAVCNLGDTAVLSVASQLDEVGIAFLADLL